MKKSHYPLTTLLFFIVLTTEVFAQSVPRYLLLEHFTNTLCSLCPSRNADLNEVLEANPNVIHHISYHPSVPYNQCILYNANIPGNTSRQNLYGVQYTPQAFLFGSKVFQGSTLLPESALNDALGQRGALGISVEEVIVGQTGGVTVHVRTYDTIPEGDVRIFVAIVEKTIDYQAPNGETIHHNVFRTMLPGDEGEEFTPAAPGESVTLSYAYNVDNSWASEELYAIVFIQEMNSKEVINSGTRFDLRAQLSSVPANPNGSASVIATGGLPPYTYKWNDPAGQTTATATGLAAGIYQVSVMDATGLIVEDTVSVAGTVGIADAWLQNKVKIYPNPSTEKVKIILEDLKFSEIYMEIVSPSGELLLQPEVSAQQLENREIDVSEIPSGIYFIRLFVDDQLIVKKLIHISDDF